MRTRAASALPCLPWCLGTRTHATCTHNLLVASQAVLDSGVTLVSVGHRPSLVKFHQRVLQLSPPPAPGAGAGWRVVGAAEYAAEAGAEAVAAAAAPR